MVTWAIGSTDLDAAVAAARAAGFDPGEPEEMSRSTPEGELLEWRLTSAFAEPSGLVPFLIDWGRTVHPSSRGLPQAELVSFAGFAPEPADLSRTVITNTYLNATEAEVLSVFNSNEIRKNRYYFEFEGRKFSVDMFLGDLFGLVMAEVSFETDEEMDNYPKPSFALADVTNNELFSGGKLCELTFAEVRAEIQRSGLLATTVSVNSE